MDACSHLGDVAETVGAHPIRRLKIDLPSVAPSCPKAYPMAVVALMLLGGGYGLCLRRTLDVAPANSKA